MINSKTAKAFVDHVDWFVNERSHSEEDSLDAVADAHKIVNIFRKWGYISGKDEIKLTGEIGKILLDGLTRDYDN